MAEFPGLLELVGFFQQLVLASLAIEGAFTGSLHICRFGGTSTLGFLLRRYLQHNSLCEVYMSSKHTCIHYLS